MFKRILQILLDSVLAFFCLLAFGQFYSWFYGWALAAMAVYAALLILVGVKMARRRKQGDAKASGKLHLVMVLMFLLPPVLAMGILVLAFSAMVY